MAKPGKTSSGKVAPRFQSRPRTFNASFDNGGSMSITVSGDLAKNLASYRMPQNLSGDPRTGNQGRQTSGPPITMGQGKMGVSQDPMGYINAQLQKEDWRDRKVEQWTERSFAEGTRRFDVGASIQQEQNRISRLEANNLNNYRMGSLGVERYKADQTFAVNNRQLDQERELALAEMNMKQNQFREGLGAERQERAADRAAQYTDREQQIEGLRYQQDAETKRTKIQAQTSRYGADLDYASRMASNFSNTFQQANQGWGQMIASFLSR